MGTMKILPLGVIFLCKVFLGGFAEDSSCTLGFDSEMVVFKVHRDHLHKGERLGRVIFNACSGRTRILFQSTDKRFDVNTDGTVMLKRSVTLHEGHMEFLVVTWDSSGNRHTVSVRVEHVHHYEPHTDAVMNISSTQIVPPSDDLVLTFPKSSTGLKRAKRGWVVPPINILENSRGPFPMDLVKIKSDFAVETQMAYKITGEGADQDPKGLFTIERLSGWLRVTQPLDREKKASYKLVAHSSGLHVDITEKPVEIIVNVMDQNDNNPVFTQNPFNGHVHEAAEAGHEVMVVTATDADDPDTDNGDVGYSIVSQDPPFPKPNMFAINVVSGGIYVQEKGMDREQWPKYTLVIAAADSQGTGRSTTGRAVITVTRDDGTTPSESPHTAFATGSPAWTSEKASKTFCLQ